jgi:allantoin racemase
VAPLEAGLLLASILAERVSVITPGPLSEVAWIEDSARFYGLEHKIASILIAEVAYPPPDDIGKMMIENPEQVAHIILESHEQSIRGDVLQKARKAIECDGAGGLYLACTFWTGMLASLEQKLGIPVIDPGFAALGIAEVLANRRSKLTGEHRRL